MRKLVGTVLAIAALTRGGLVASPLQQKRALDYIKDYQCVFFSIPLQQKPDLDHLNTVLSLSHVEGERLYAYANAAEFQTFLKEGLDYTVETMPGEGYDPRDFFTGHLADFHGQSLLNYSQYVALLNQYAQENPDICKLYEVGKSIKGKSILCLRLTSGLDKDDQPKRPRFLFSCAVHGDELNGTLLSYHFMDFLISGHKKGDPDAKRFLEGLDLFVMPHLNPDGAFPRGDTMAGCTRCNAAGVDLNRTYPSPGKDKRSEEEAIARSQPETKATIAFEKLWRFNFALDYHDYARSVIHPWGYKKPAPHTVNWLKDVAKVYAEPLHYKIEQASSWYVASGARMDWQPFFNHCRGFTIECENKGLPAQAKWEVHQPGIFNILKETMGGITGTVSGANVANTQVNIQRSGQIWDKEGSEAYARDNGFYVHYAPAGTWDVVFTNGTKTKTVTGVEVSYGKPTKVDVDLD